MAGIAPLTASSDVNVRLDEYRCLSERIVRKKLDNVVFDDPYPGVGPPVTQIFVPDGSADTGIEDSV